MNFFRLFFSFSIFVLLTACSSDGEERPEYLDSVSIKGLEVPPTLTRPNNREELKIPKPSAKALALLKEREDAEGTVAPIFKGIELQSDQGMYWLLVEEDADVLWPLLRDFWANEGIKIDRDEPLLGFMETEWIKEYKESRDSGFYSRMMNILSADLLDKFRLRVERIKGQKKTRIYISHRAMEIVVVEDSSSWQQKEADRSIERELLYRLVLFAGLSKEKADDAFADYKPYKNRIQNIDGTSDYQITGRTDFVWRRLMLALDRLGVEIKNQNKKDAVVEVLVEQISDEFFEKESESSKYIDPEKINDEQEVREEESKSSDLSTMVSDEEKKNKSKAVAIFVTLKPDNGSTRMLLTLAEGKEIESGLSGQFREGLVNLLK